MTDKQLVPELIGEHTLSVRYAETDQMGVVYHANYLVWFHEARDALLAKLGLSPARMERLGNRFPVVDIGCRYLASAHYGDQVNVIAYLMPERIARMRFRYEVRHARSKRLLATGHSVSVMIDQNGKLLLRLPQEIEESLFEKKQTQAAQVEGSQS